MKYYILISIFLFISGASNSQSTDSLKVISWNVFLRPGILRDKQVKRVDSIAGCILKMDGDVIALQEVFHKRSRKKLIKALSKVYPYHTVVGKKSFWGVPSGNCIFSKDSILSEKYIYYQRAIIADKMAKKGAISIHFEHRGRPFNMIGTHLQAGGGKEGADIRKSQIDEMSNLVSDNSLSTSIFVGDFNINYEDSLHAYLCQKLDATNYEPSNRELGTANFNDHTLTSTSDTPKWIDFIIFQSTKDVFISDSHIEEPRCYFKEKPERVSDHNPIITVFHW